MPIYNIDYVEQNPFEVQLSIEPSLFFEVLLLTIRRETVSFGIKKKRAEKQKEEELQLQILNNEIELDKSGSYVTMQKLEEQKKELENIREHRLRGSLIRSRAIWREYSEKPSRYFLTLEKRRFDNKRISHLVTDTGAKRTPVEILGAFKEYFAKKFCSEGQANGREYDEYLNDIEVKNLSAEEGLKLQAELSSHELGRTLQQMKNGTSPGSDGFSVEFYKFFWSDLKNFFIALCNDCWEKGTITRTMNEGRIVFLPKPKKPRELIRSYRPITLLNVHYKIISGTIANRMKVVLNSIIDPNQTAFLKNRFIGDNIRMIYDAIQYMTNEQLSGILLSLDIEAAFDSVSWNFVRKALEKCNFPSNIVRWFNILYVGSFARVIYNGHLSAEIPLSRSCRQGDALSCYLFILVMDILGKKIQKNRCIKGIKLGQREHKITMYADDTVCFLEPNKKSFESLFSELGWFAKYSGLRPNLEKTKAIWIGKIYRDSNLFERQVDISWCKELQILGVTFENDLCKIVEAYNEKIKDIEREIEKWKHRNISIQGKVTVIKSLLLSKVSYLFLSLPNPPREVISRLTKVLHKYLWNGKSEKINRTTLTKRASEGGVGMVNINTYVSALKISWIRRLLSKPSTWSTIVNTEIGGQMRLWQMGAKAIRKKCPI